MPKRIPTPPPGDDEPKYLTVVYPYAMQGTCNMELPKDRQDFARWVACCIDRDAFFAIFHKHSSRGMVIIEVNRNYAHFDRILGEHRWSEFLQKPTPDEKERVTQVFYCTYNTGRIVQKNGWKRIDVDEAWFKGWSERNRNITYPYPPTRFCEVPVEDLTNLSMCRPLPGAVKVTPVEVIAAPQPVVGSAEWIQTKGGKRLSAPAPASAVAPSKPKSAWDKDASKIAAAWAKPANVSVKKTVSTPQTLNTKAPAIGGGPVVVKSTNVWKNTAKKPAPAPAVANWDESAPVTREGTPVSRAISPLSTQQAPVAPPVLSAPQNVWQRGPPGLVVPNQTASSVTQNVPERSNSSSTSCWDSTGNSTSSPDSDSGPDLTTATESDNPYAVHIHFSESMEEEFHGMGIRAIDDEGDLKELDSIAPGNWDDPVPPMWGATDAGGWDNAPDTGGWDNVQNTGGWDNDPVDAEDQWRQQAQPAEQQMLCKAHGVVCKKGICAEYARQVRLAKRAEEDEKRKAAKTNKGKKGGRSRKKTDENDEEATERRPMVNNAFRGPGAPVKTNWRGAPRAIVSADAIEKREMTKAASEDGWGNSDSEAEPNVAVTASNASWDVPEGATRTDPWAVTAQPAKTNNNNRTGGAGKPQQGKKKPAQTKAGASWADQVDAELAAAADGSLSVATSKRSKRGGSTTSWGTSAAKSSTSGWGEVPEMPW